MRPILRLAALSLLVGLGTAAPAVAAPVFLVTKTADTADGLCNGDCSLREALIAANAAGQATVNVPEGSYVLTIAGQGEDAAATGDLDVAAGITLVGAGATKTYIEAAPTAGATPVDRVIDVLAGATLSLSDATVRYGALRAATDTVPTGGAIRTAGTLTLSGVAVTDSVVATTCACAAHGGGLAIDHPTGDTTITDSSFVANHADGTAGQGGGIWAVDPVHDLRLRSSTISGNAATSAAGLSIAATTELTNDTVAGNAATAGDGGGALLTSTATAPVFLRFSTVVGNDAAGNGAGLLLAGTGPVLVQRSIIAANRSQYVSDAQFTATSCAGRALSTIGQNFEDGTSCGLEHQNAALALGPLQMNGGPVDTIAVLPGSAAIDPGVDLGGCPLIAPQPGVLMVPPPVTVDARGVHRPAGAGCEAGAYEAGRPQNTTPPTVTVFDTNAICYPGTWSDSPTGVEWLWFYDGAAVLSQTGPVYPVTPADWGHTLSCRVTVSNAAGDGTSQSAVVIIRDPRPVAIGAGATISSDGTTLTCTPGTFVPTPTSLAYGWQRGDTTVAAVASASRPIVPADWGATLRCTVTPTRAGFAGPAAISAPITVTDPRPHPSQPTIAGTATAVAGTVLTCSVATWTNDPTAFAFTWSREGATVAGAETATYSVLANDIATRIGCTARGTNALGTGPAVASPSYPIGAEGPPINDVPPAITPPVLRAGDTAHCSTGTWRLNPSGGAHPFLYSWSRNGVDIPRTELLPPNSPPAMPIPSTYVTTLDDVDGDLRCTVVATNHYHVANANPSILLGSTSATSPPVTVGHAATTVDASPQVTFVGLPAGTRVGAANGSVDVAVHVTGPAHVVLKVYLPGGLDGETGNAAAGSSAWHCTNPSLRFIVCTSQFLGTSHVRIPVGVVGYGNQTVDAVVTVAETDPNAANDEASGTLAVAQPRQSDVVTTAVIVPADTEPGTVATCVTTPSPTPSRGLRLVRWVRDHEVVAEARQAIAPTSPLDRTYIVQTADVGHKLHCEAQLVSSSAHPTDLAISPPITPVQQLQASASMATADTPASAASGLASMQINCSAVSRGCSGVLRLLAAANSLHGSTRARVRLVSIGTATFTARAGQATTVRIRINARARAWLRRARTLHVTARLSYRTGSGAKAVLSRPLTLEAT